MADINPDLVLSVPVRETFVRLSQIAVVLNVDSPQEILELQMSAGSTSGPRRELSQAHRSESVWAFRLSTDQIRQVLMLREGFDLAEITRVINTIRK